MKNIELKDKIMYLNIVNIYIANFNVLNEQYGLKIFGINNITIKHYSFYIHYTIFSKYRKIKYGLYNVNGWNATIRDYNSIEIKLLRYNGLYTYGFYSGVTIELPSLKFSVLNEKSILRK